MNKQVSWKILLPVGVALIIIGYVWGTVVGSMLNVLGLIMTLMGIVEVVKSRK